MWVRLILILFAFLIFYQPAVDAKQLFKPAKVYPVDEGWKDKFFVQFRNKLIDIARRKDVKALIPYIDEKIQFSWGIDSVGRKQFLKLWDLKPGHRSQQSERFWKEFTKVITHGGKFENWNVPPDNDPFFAKAKPEIVFKAPYYTAVWPKEKYNSLEFSEAIGKYIKVYSRFKNKLTPYKLLSYDIVKLPQDKTGNISEESFKYKGTNYKAIFLSTGEKVYINESYLGNACWWDFRAVFKKQDNGKWLLDMFISGD